MMNNFGGFSPSGENPLFTIAVSRKNLFVLDNTKAM